MKTWAGALAAVSVLLSSAAVGSTLVKQTIESLAAQSSVVVRATVVSSQPRQAGRTVVTVHRLAVSELLKGDVGEAVTVVTRGGELAQVGVRVDGEAALAPGDELVLFLTPTESGVFTVTGLAQGAFRVEPAAASRTEWLSPAAIGTARLVERAGGAQAQLPQTRLSLEQLRARLAALKRGGR